MVYIAIVAGLSGDGVSRNGAPEEIRTPDPQIRSLVLYPAELRARFLQNLSGPGGPPMPHAFGNHFRGRESAP
jgi:hypothetical protein